MDVLLYPTELPRHLIKRNFQLVTPILCILMCLLLWDYRYNSCTPINILALQPRILPLLRK